MCIKHTSIYTQSINVYVSICSIIYIINILYTFILNIFNPSLFLILVATPSWRAWRALVMLGWSC